MDIFIQQVVSGLATGGIYASLALALVMIYQATDVVNFAQGEMAMFSTYLAWTMLQAGLPYWVAFVATVAIAFVGGLVIERVVIRPVENAPILGLLFLNNNLHVAHHLRFGLPWYQIPEFYRLNREALVRRNGGLVYDGYFDVFRRYGLAPHDRLVHPDWTGRAA